MLQRVLNISLASFLALSVASLFSTAQATTVFVSTDMTGANVQCDINHTQHWTYSVSADVEEVGGALLVMKRGPKTTADINFMIFEGTFSNFGTAAPLLDVSLSPNYFTQSYGEVFFEGAHVTLKTNTVYTGVLYSSSKDSQNEAYFLKGGSLRFVDGAGNPVNTGGSIIDPVTNQTVPGAPPVPEPLTAIALFMGAIGLGSYMRRRTAPGA